MKTIEEGNDKSLPDVPAVLAVALVKIEEILVSSKYQSTLAEHLKGCVKQLKIENVHILA